jgi:hypothetical protein
MPILSIQNVLNEKFKGYLCETAREFFFILWEKKQTNKESERKNLIFKQNPIW